MSNTQSKVPVRELHTQQLDEWDIDPFNLARSFSDSEGRDDQGRPTLRLWQGEWYWYRDGHYVKHDEKSIRVDLTGFIKAYIDLNKCVDAKGKALRVTTALVSNTLQALAPIVAVPDTAEMPVWLGDDRERQLVAFRNRLLDLTDVGSGEFDVVESTPDWFSVNIFPYDFDPEASCPQWERFIREAMQDDAELIALLQEWFGYCLTPETKQHKFLVVEGEGANGKSVVLDVLTALLGEENVSQVPLEMFGKRFQLTPTIGMLANICAEVGDISTVAEGVLKQFTAGDRMYFDRKGIPGVMCYPTARLVLATNNRPRFRDRSEGIWRRMILVPFRYTVPLHRQDRDLTKKLRAELPGIFLWAVEGLKRLRTNGRFTEPVACRQVLDEYRLESNPARVFLGDHVAAAEAKSVLCKELYQRYSDWCKDNGFETLNSAQFGKEVGKQFPAVRRVRGTTKGERAWVYAGLDYPGTSGWFQHPVSLRKAA